MAATVSMSHLKRHEKLQAYVSDLVGRFVNLRNLYAHLDPMIFDEKVTKTWGSGNANRGFETIRYTLFFSCIQSIAGMAIDADDRTPCLSKSINALEDKSFRDYLRAQYSCTVIPYVGDDDPMVLASLKAFEARERVERRIAFDDAYAQMLVQWEKLKISKELAAFRTVRDKLTAHHELRKKADGYAPVNVVELELKWGALRSMVPLLQEIVSDIDLLVRNAGFAYDILDEQLAEASAAFWGTEIRPVTVPPLR